MRNFVDLSNTNTRKRMVTLLPSLTQNDSITISGYQPFRFSNYSGCFTQYVPATCSVTKVSEVSANDSIVISDNAVFRLGYYSSLNRAQQLTKEGVGCIIVNNTDQAAIFHVDGLKFRVATSNDPSIQAYLVNMVSGSTVRTAANIAAEISQYCPNVYAYSKENCVVIKSRYENSPVCGNVPAISEVTLTGNVSTNVNIQIGNTGYSWTFICSVDGESGIDTNAKTITFAKGSSYAETLNNFQNAINTYASTTKLCFAKTYLDNGVMRLLVYLCDVSYSITTTSPFSVNSTKFPSNVPFVSIITIDSVNDTLKTVPMFNLYSNVADVTMQMAACLLANDSTQSISKIDIEENGFLVNIYQTKTFNMTSYSSFIYCSSEDAQPVTAILSNCLNSLYADMRSRGLNVSVYGVNSLKVAVNSPSFSCTDNVMIESIGSDGYSSSYEDPMGIQDFITLLQDVSEVEVSFLRTDTSASFSKIQITKDINMNIIGTGDILKLDSPLLEFQRFSNVNVKNFQLDWNGNGTDAVFDFESCQGNLSIINSEVCFRRTGHFVKTNYCLNFNISNKNSSYLLNNTTQSLLYMFNIVNSSVNLVSKDNVIDVPSSTEGVFYNKDNSYANTNGTGKDLIRKNSASFDYSRTNNQADSMNVEPFVYGMAESYSKLLCGIDSASNELLAWSFNLTCNSAALNFDYDTSAPDDIFGRKRGFNSAVGKHILSFSNESFSAISDDNYVVIGGTRFYFAKGYKTHSDISNTLKLVKAIVECVSYTSNYKIEYAEVSSGGAVTAYDLIIYGDIVSVDVSYNIRELVISNTKEIIGNIDDNSIRYLNCIDAGSRQKHTQYDSVFYVDTSIDSSGTTKARKGTEDDMFSCLDMINWCKSFYPRFGNTTFILKSVEQENVSNADLTTCFASDGEVGSEVYAVMYGDVIIKSTMQGLRAVPSLKYFGNSSTPMFKVGCYGAPNLIFENIALASNYQIIDADSNYSVFGIEFRNCILKNYSNHYIVDYKQSQFKAVESTILNANGSNSSIAIEGDGITKIEATIFGVGKLQLSSDAFNSPILSYIYQIDTSASSASAASYGSNCVVGPNCLKAEALSNTQGDFDDIKNFALNESLQNNAAIDFIPTTYNLILSNPDAMFDIGGRYRYNEVSKVSLDVGAIESEAGLVEPTSEVYYVSLGNTSEMKYAGRADYIAWEDFKNIIESITSFDKIYKVYLSGYGVGKEGIVINASAAFNEQARLEFYGERNCVFEGNSLLKANCKYSKVVVSGLITRTSETFIKLAKDSELWMTNCLAISTPYDSGYTFDVNDCSVKLYSCSIQTCENHSVFNVTGTLDLTMFGCVAQGMTDSSFGYDGTITTSYEGGLAYHNLTNITSDTSQAQSFEQELINPEVITKETLTSKDAELVTDPFTDRFALYYSDISNGTLKKLFEEGLKFNWITDIDGNIRALDIHSKKFSDNTQQKDFLTRNSLFTSYGCFDSKATDSDKYFDSNPNREITCVTEIGRTMITRMLSDTVRFKIEGFAICSDGYDYNNPVLASKIKVDTRTVIRYAVQAALVSAASATITIGDFVLNKEDFEGADIKETTINLVSAINTIKYVEGELAKSSIFAASIINAYAGEFEVERLMPGTNSDELICSVTNGLTKISTVSPTENVQYDKYQVLPKNEFNVFEHIEYLPLAIAMYYRIEREVWSGAFGSEVVYARVVESDNESEVNMLFPICVCHHGLITKGHDSFLVGRIILQI